MTNDEIITFLLQSQKSLDSQLHTLVETVDKMAQKADRVADSMKEWHEDRQKMHGTMTNVFEHLDKFATAAEQRSKEADARMARLEKLFERSIERGPNGQH